MTSPSLFLLTDSLITQIRKQSIRYIVVQIQEIHLHGKTARMRAVVYSYKYYEGKKINASKETEQKKRVVHMQN